MVGPANLSIVGELPRVLCSNRVKLTLEARDTWVWLPFSVFHDADMLLLSSSLFKDFLFFFPLNLGFLQLKYVRVQIHDPMSFLFFWDACLRAQLLNHMVTAHLLF